MRAVIALAVLVTCGGCTPRAAVPPPVTASYQLPPARPSAQIDYMAEQRAFDRFSECAIDGIIDLDDRVSPANVIAAAAVAACETQLMRWSHEISAGMTPTAAARFDDETRRATPSYLVPVVLRVRAERRRIAAEQMRQYLRRQAPPARPRDGEPDLPADARST